MPQQTIQPVARVVAAGSILNSLISIQYDYNFNSSSRF